MDLLLLVGPWLYQEADSNIQWGVWAREGVGSRGGGMGLQRGRGTFPGKTQISNTLSTPLL